MCEKGRANTAVVVTPAGTFCARCYFRTVKFYEACGFPGKGGVGQRHSNPAAPWLARI